MQTDEYDFNIIRSPRRKRIALRLTPEGKVEILCPQGTGEAVLKQLISANLHLIDKLKRRQSKQPAPQRLSFAENDLLPLLGKNFPLHLSSRLTLFDGERFIIPRSSDPDELKSALTSLYKAIALKYLTSRTATLAGECGFSYNKLRITSATTRWGSCNSQKTIAYSWKLIMCPKPLIDYVIIHELSHLLELNHSPEFWKIVQKFCPDYKERRSMLKKFARTLPAW